MESPLPAEVILMETLEEVLVRKLDTTWADPELRARGHRLLMEYGAQPWEREPDLVRLALLRLAEGSLKSLSVFLAVAHTDYRDVLSLAVFPRVSALPVPPRALDPEERQAILDARNQDRRSWEDWLAR